MGDDELQQAVRELRDRQAIADLIHKMARAVDRQDAALMSSLFHPDATDDHGMFKGTAADFVPWVMGVLAAMKMTQHVLGNMLIELDGERAVAETYFIAHHRIAGGGELIAAETGQPDQFMLAGGRYLDRFERRDGVWRFSHRQAVYDWNSGQDSTDRWDRPNLGGWAFGSADRTDPSYALFERIG